jgi:Fe-S oxidoreductase
LDPEAVDETGEPVMSGSGDRKAFLGLREEARICASCGSCKASCPIYSEIGWESASPRGKILLADQLMRPRGGGKFPEEAVRRALQCTLCGSCRESCPAAIDTRQAFLELREEMRAKGKAPEAFARLAANVAASGNVGGFDRETRADWVEELDEPDVVVAAEEEAEIGYFVGCVASFYPMVADIPESFARLAELMSLRFAVLGAEEVCCGFPLIGAGMMEEAERLIRQNIERVEQRKIKTLVTGCPSCYHTWTHVYPEVLGHELGVEVQHFTQFLLRCVTDGSLDVSELDELDEVVTYHDPCDLGRNAGIYDEPRRVITSLPGVTFVEMAHHGKEALCCGGGGNLQSVDPDLTKAIADTRIEEARETGATTLVTACQQCVQVLTEASRRTQAGIEVVDIVQFVLRAFE